MRLLIEDHEGILHEVVDRLEDYDLTRTVARASLVNDVENELARLELAARKERYLAAYKRITYDTTARCDCRFHDDENSASGRCGNRIKYATKRSGDNAYCDPCFESRLERDPVRSGCKR